MPAGAVQPRKSGAGETMSVAMRASTLAAGAALASLLGAATAFGAIPEVSPAARWSGDYGLAIDLPGTGPSYVETPAPAAERRFIARFYFNADEVVLGAGGSVVLFRAVSGAAAPVVSVLLQSDGGSGKRLVYTLATDAGQAPTPELSVGAGWHFLELDWAAASGAGANDGSLETRLDQAPTAALTGLDNDQAAIAAARWGAVALGGAPVGTLWLDDFASRRLRAIGPVLAGSLDLDGDGSVDALTDGVVFLRWSVGLTGAPLIAGAVGQGCRYCTEPAIRARLAALRAVLDVDGDGGMRPLTDNVLLLRFLFGLTGPTLTQGAVAEGATRPTPADVTGYLQALE